MIKQAYYIRIQYSGHLLQNCSKHTVSYIQYPLNL